VGTGGGSYIACPNVEAGLFSGQNLLLGPSTALSEGIWKKYNNGVYSSVNAAHPKMRVSASMYGGVTVSMADGSTPLAWADDVAQVAVSNGLGIGAESLNGTSDQGDNILYASGNPCSNDWCALFTRYYLTAPILTLQTLSVSDPACLNVPTAGCNQTGSLVTVLPFGTQHRGGIFEIKYEDLICTYSPNGTTLYGSTTCPATTVTSVPYPPYQNALTNAANRVPSTTGGANGKSALAGRGSVK